MKIEYNLNKINEFSPNEYVILVLVALENFNLLNELISTRRREYSSGVLNLVNGGLLKDVIGSNHIDATHLVLTTEGRKLLDKSSIAKVTVRESEVEKWIDDWRNLFPSGKSGGYPIKGNRKNCLKKMVSFMKSYQYDKETIINATKSYISNFNGSFEYIQNAPYFIEKNKNSNLASFCEEIIEGGGEIKKDNVINL